MTLELCRRSPYKVYVKKLGNGFGIKTLNTLTGVEQILIITAKSNNGSCSDKKVVDAPRRVLRPIFNKFSEETVNASLSIPRLKFNPNYEINKVLAHIEPYLREIKPDISGFHIFEASNTESSPNVQKTSVIFVSNTELARKKSLHFNIPGELMNVFFVDGKNKEGKIKFRADSVVKPLTIIVSDYTLHINICYDVPSKPQIKTVGTQTKKRYVLSSSVDNNKHVYQIESSLLSDLQVNCQQGEQTIPQKDSSILINGPKLSQLNLHKHYQDKSVQTSFFKDLVSHTRNLSSEKICYYCRVKTGLNSDEGNSKVDSFDNNSKQTIGDENVSRSFTSYDSHAHMHQTVVLKYVKDKQVYKTASIESKQNVKELTSTDGKKEKTTLTLFNNTSNYDTKTTISDDAFNNIEHSYSRNSTGTSQTPTFKEDTSKTFMNTEDLSNEATRVRNVESSSNVSIKDIIERLNKTTLSLQQLYSVVEQQENANVNRSRSETRVLTSGYTCVQHKNETDMSRQTNTHTQSKDTLEESVSTNSSDKSVNLRKTRPRSNQSNTIDCEKSLRDSKDTASLDVLCEPCGSFHSGSGFESDCKKFGKNNVKIIENKRSQVAINSGSPTDLGNISNNIKSEPAIANILRNEVQSCGSSDSISNAMQRGFDFYSKDSTISVKEHTYLTMDDESRKYSKSDKHNKTQLLDTDKDDIDHGAPREMLEDSNHSLVDHDSKQDLYENKNHSESNVRKSPKETFIYRREFELDETSTYGHNLDDFEGTLQFYNPNSQTLQEIKTPSNNTISGNVNCISEECIETKTGFVNSTQNFTSLHGTFEENTKKYTSFSSILSNQNTQQMGDNKVFEANNSAQNIQVSNSFLWLSHPNSSISTNSKKSAKSTTYSLNENKTESHSRVLYFTEVRNTKSWISFKKSVQSCHYNEKLGLPGNTTNSEPITNHQCKTLSAGDHKRESVLCRVSSSFQKKLKTIGLFSNKSNFSINKYSSLSTLHIDPSREALDAKEALAKVEDKSPTFKIWDVKFQGNGSKREDGNPACTSRYSQGMTFDYKLEQKYTDEIKNSNNSKITKTITQNKYDKTKSQNSKNKKTKLFCFFK